MRMCLLDHGGAFESGVFDTRILENSLNAIPSVIRIFYTTAVKYIKCGKELVFCFVSNRIVIKDFENDLYCKDL